MIACFRCFDTLNDFVYLLCTALLKPKHIPDKAKFYQSNQCFQEISRQLLKILQSIPPSELYAKIFSKNPHSQSCLESTQTVQQSCNNEAAPLPEGCILSRILDIQKLADRHSTAFKRDSSIYKIYQKICPVHAGNKSSAKTISSSTIMSSTDLDFNCRTTDTSPRLNVILTGDSYDCDNFVDSGNETERMSDSESLEEAFDNSSTEEDEDETIMASVSYDGEAVSAKCNDSKIHNFHESFQELQCPSSACLTSEKWLDEIENLPLSEFEIMAVEMYLLAATAKDCSIMVTFSPTSNNCEEKEQKQSSCSTDSNSKDTDILLQDLFSKMYSVRIGVADLDPKPVTTIVRHYLRDNEMFQAYVTHCRNMSF